MHLILICFSQETSSTLNISRDLDLRNYRGSEGVMSGLMKCLQFLSDSAKDRDKFTNRTIHRKTSAKAVHNSAHQSNGRWATGQVIAATTMKSCLYTVDHPSKQDPTYSNHPHVGKFGSIQYSNIFWLPCPELAIYKSPNFSQSGFWFPRTNVQFPWYSVFLITNDYLMISERYTFKTNALFLRSLQQYVTWEPEAPVNDLF